MSAPPMPGFLSELLPREAERDIEAAREVNEGWLRAALTDASWFGAEPHREAAVFVLGAILLSAQRHFGSAY